MASWLVFDRSRYLETLALGGEPRPEASGTAASSHHASRRHPEHSRRPWGTVRTVCPDSVYLQTYFLTQLNKEAHIISLLSLKPARAPPEGKHNVHYGIYYSGLSSLGTNSEQ